MESREQAEQLIKLPVLKIMLGAILMPWFHRNQYAKALALPLIALVIFTCAGDVVKNYLPGFLGWIWSILYSAIFSWFAVACHRIVLLG